MLYFTLVALTILTAPLVTRAQESSPASSEASSVSSSLSSETTSPPSSASSASSQSSNDISCREKRGNAKAVCDCKKLYPHKDKGFGMCVAGSAKAAKMKDKLQKKGGQKMQKMEKKGVKPLKRRGGGGGSGSGGGGGGY